jgi:hypothetical protein
MPLVQRMSSRPTPRQQIVGGSAATTPPSGANGDMPTVQRAPAGNPLEQLASAAGSAGGAISSVVGAGSQALDALGGRGGVQGLPGGLMGGLMGGLAGDGGAAGPAGAGGGAAGISPRDLDELARRLYHRISRQMKQELRRDREQFGINVDQRW